MNRIEQMIQELCPNGIQFVPLAEIATIKNGRDYKHLEEGPVPVYGSGGILAHVNEPAYVGETVLLPRKGSLSSVFYVDGPVWTVDTCYYTVIDESTILPKFFYYYMVMSRLERLNTAGGVPSLTQRVLNKLLVPVPPIEVQREIVKILDLFTELEAELETELKAELEARRKQYEHYRDQLLTFPENGGVTWVELGSLGKWYGGSTPSKSEKKYWAQGTIPWVSPKDMGVSHIDRTIDFVTMDAMNSARARLIPAGAILVVTRSSILAKRFPVAIAANEVTINQDLKALVPQGNVDARYVFHALNAYGRQILLKATKHGGSVNSIEWKRFARFKIPVPNVSEQKKIAAHLDKFDALVNDLSSGLPAEIEARRKQYEYYRDKLLTFKELETEAA
ncbi:restriction endonuclease subunit S [Pseudoglutamicibacter albus]|uniref:restriction endonuclease subunit S n=1 Tax=Pseudoglutamicibacter albus TaxID=98671 RepID=UPI001EF60C48|nr:restriction endonuclease subunit S [Pseudoglutamicibacter albus]MCG7303848.1 restriction endonuclease subunit S [Pseudoglutamicibacter albus]